MGGVLKDIPNAVWWLITLVVVSLIGSLTYLSAIGADTTEIRQFTNILANLGGLILGGGGFALAGAAAINAKKAADQTNGNLTTTVRKAVRDEIQKNGGGDDGRPVV